MKSKRLILLINTWEMILETSWTESSQDNQGEQTYFLAYYPLKNI